MAEREMLKQQQDAASLARLEAVRLELAALGRILYMYGFGSDLAAQCIIARVRDEPDAMLMNECMPPPNKDSPARAAR